MPAPPVAPADPVPLPTTLPSTPVSPADFLSHVSKNSQLGMRTLTAPFREHESVLRAYFAQAPDHSFVATNTVNLVDVYGSSGTADVHIEGRDLEGESESEKERFILQLDPKIRRKHGELVVVPTLKDFKTNFGVFTEGALLDLDWNNVVVAGSAVLTPLLVVPGDHGESKRSLRNYYHEILAPAADIDMFLYGLEEKDAIAKIQAIETTIRNNLLWETTTIRTRNTITIVSQYPNRHVQIVLRLYKSISQILTGFDVDCSAFAFNGTHVYGSPRALAACITQCNDIDLTRRSPSYENRLSKYSHRGFEVYCDFLDRKRIDPTIFERSFSRTTGLARLLVLEALPQSWDRDNYMAQRRTEMGRPDMKTNNFRVDKKNKKALVADEVAEWDFQDISGYQKFSLPYGEGYNAKKIEKLFFKKDLILNAEWNKLNKPPHRMVNLHRHPVFFGNVVDVVGDCCGFCPEPLNDEEKAVAEEEGKLYVKGAISFLSDDPGRQEIGSFYPLGPEDYTDMAYVGSSQVVCDAIVNNDVDIVRSWCQQDGVDVDVRDFCGRTPLHLACMSTTTEMEVVQCLIDHGARLVARLQDGRTALHLAAARGSVEMVTALLRKSAENEHERDEKLAAAGKKLPLPEDQDAVMKDKEEDSDDSSSSGEDDDNGSDDSFSKIHRSDAGSVQAPTVTTSGFVKVDLSETIDGDNDTVVDDIYDINITDWDYLMTPLHHAILGEHTDVIETLVSDFGADVRKPVLKRDHDQGWHTSNALLNLVLALKLSEEKRYDILATLLKLGASSTQATLNQDGSKTSALNYLVSSGEIPALETVFEHDTPGAMSVLNNVIRGRGTSISPLITAIHKEKPELIHYLLKKGAHTDITSEDIVRNMKASERQKLDAGRFQSEIATSVSQPLFFALCHNLDAQVVEALIKAGAELNAVLGKSLSYEYHQTPRKFPVEGLTLLDYARKNIFGARELARVSAHTITTLEETSKKIEEVKKEKTQEELFPDEWVLAQNTDDTYSHFAARILVQKRVLLRSRPKPVYIGYNGYYATPLELAMFNLQHANKLLVEYVKIEPLLEAAGAKTYFELHLEMLPEYLATKNGKMEDFRLPEALRTSNKDKEMSPESLFSAPQLFGALQPFGMLQPVAQMPGEIQRPEFSLGTFHTPYLGKGDVQGGYMRIFEAAWRGLPEDLEMVRMLTSGPSGEGDSRVPALRMAVTDSNNLNAMFIALIRENYDMVDLILQIVKEQYEPAPVVIQKPEGFESENGDVEPQRYIEDDDSEHDPVAEAEAVEQNMTKSDTSPWSYFTGAIASPESILSPEEYQALLKKDIESVNRKTSNFTTLSYAIYKNDIPLLKRVVKLIRTAATLSDMDPVEMLQSFTAYKETHLELAISLGRVHVLEELMSSVSFGVPYQDLAFHDEAFQKATDPTSGHYQGLSIHGAKNKNWLDASFPVESGNYSDTQRKPLHLAAYRANLPSLQWIMSPRPWECLTHFIKDNKNSHHVRMVEESELGIAKLFQKGLGLETSLLPHICIAGWRGQSSKSMLDHLFSIAPETLESRTTAGLTPALYAIRSLKLEAVEYLIQAGADFSARDVHARNVLHHLLTPKEMPTVQHVDKLKTYIAALPAAAVAEAWSQRCSGTLHTPIAAWISRSVEHKSTHLPTLRLLIELSAGEGLAAADQLGNLPIHTLFLAGEWEAAGIVLQYHPEFWGVENGNGRTLSEIAEAGWRKICVGSVFSNVECPNLTYFRQSWSEHRYGHDINVKEWRVGHLKSLREKSGEVEEEKLDENKVRIKEMGKVGNIELWKIVREYEGRERRKLVGLDVAGLLAKRVIGYTYQNKAGKYGGVVSKTDDEGDVLTLY